MWGDGTCAGVVDVMIVILSLVCLRSGRGDAIEYGRGGLDASREPLKFMAQRRSVHCLHVLAAMTRVRMRK